MIPVGIFDNEPMRRYLEKLRRKAKDTLFAAAQRKKAGRSFGFHIDRSVFGI
jgi:hypothetical protein